MHADLLQKKSWRVGALVAIVSAAGVAAASANQWNDKTILKFSEPVMVPGATLQPGSYVFKLMDSASSRHTVQITTEDGSKVLALTQAIPTKRPDPKGDIVLKFNPTDAGLPPALKAWFYPGSIYGHEFIYPEEQARQIADRTKTIVLSIDVPGTDLEKGTLRTINASGQRTEWRGDTATLREWNEWRQARSNTAGQSASAEERRQATAPMVKGDFQGMRVKLDQLEDNLQVKRILLWSPEFFGGDLAWLHEAEDSPRIESGGAVDRWDDLSVAGRHFAQTGPHGRCARSTRAVARSSGSTGSTTSWR